MGADQNGRTLSPVKSHQAQGITFKQMKLTPHIFNHTQIRRKDLKTFDMQTTNNLAYSNFRNLNMMSRLTQDSTSMNQTNGFGAATPMSQSMKSKKLTFSKHGQIESDAFTL